LRILGAQVEVLPSVPSEDPRFFIKVAKTMAEEMGAFFVNQFYNIHNFLAHYETTASEIWEQTEGVIDAIVLSAGTGGTIAGCSNFLKEKNPNILCYLIDSPGSGVKYSLNNGELEMHKKSKEEKQNEQSTVLEGVGSSEIYLPLSKARLDGVFLGDDQLAIEMSHFLLNNEGIFVGPSAGLNVLGAVWMAKKLGPNHTIVTILTDGGRSYCSKTFDQDWLSEHRFQVQGMNASQILETYTYNRQTCGLH